MKLSDINPKMLDSLNEEQLASLLWQVKNMSSLPYVATEKQMQFHQHPARSGKEPVLYGGAMGRVLLI